MLFGKLPHMEEHSTALAVPVEKAKETIHQYGLGPPFAVTIFGAEPVYILTQSGVTSEFADRGDRA